MSDIVEKLRSENQQETACQSYEAAISDDRYQVVRSRFLWRIKIGDGEALYGKFHSKASAEAMASLLRREFMNGAFIVHKRNSELRELGKLIAEGARRGVPVPYA